MREIIKETCYKGTRILIGESKRRLINNLIWKCQDRGFREIQIPIIQFQETFAKKVGEENRNMMFNFTDRAKRKVCLAPEYTSVIQQLAKTVFKHECRKLFYVQQCFRGEKPQAGRYREFTQFGVEIINAVDYIQAYSDVIEIAEDLLHGFNVTFDYKVKRGLDYYNDGQGFEARDKNGMQILGGGGYDGGVGFAIGIDRLI